VLPDEDGGNGSVEGDEVISPREYEEAFEELRLTLAMFRRWLDHELSSAVTTLEDGIMLDSNGAGTLDLGAPPLDRQWDVRRVNVSPQTGTSTAVATIFRGNGINHPMMYVDRTKTDLPEVAPWDEHQFTLRPGESLLLRITGGTAATRMFASAQVVEEIVDVVPVRDGQGVVSRLYDWWRENRAVS